MVRSSPSPQSKGLCLEALGPVALREEGLDLGDNLGKGFEPGLEFGEDYGSELRVN